MTVEQVEKFKNKEPFETFHMSDGHSFRIDGPEPLLRRDWGAATNC